MKLDCVVDALNLAAHVDSLAPHWEDSMDCLPGAGLPFLQGPFVAEACRTVSLSDAAISPLQAAAERLDRNGPLQALMWHMHRALFGDLAGGRADTGPWVALSNDLGEHSPALYLLMALSGVPRAQALHEQRQIPEEVRRDTCQDIALWATEYHDEFDLWGIKAPLLGWFTNHLSGELYRIGRLQYVLRPFRGKLVAFRRVATGEVVALAEAGIQFRRDGQFDGTSGVTDPEPWTSELTIDENGARGNPVSPRGHAVRTEIVLPAADWQRALTPGDVMLEMHIPAGSPMAYEECGDSMRRAPEFFRRHFPETPFKGFCCTSWLLDSQLPELLPPTSNLVRFMQEFYCYPFLSNGNQTFERVFGEKPSDLTKAPRDTSLRRILLDHLLAGGQLRAGGVFLLTEDLRWGEQVYLTGTRHFQ